MNEPWIAVDGDHRLTVKSSTVVEIHEQLKLFTDKGKVEVLDVKIKADFGRIPPEHHQIFIQMMNARYGGVVKCYDNTSPFKVEDKPKNPWWVFWK